ncbi:unnamed protein product [Bursaphelenchus okinawaensis]|uniref:EGF-like domain-containing protein n=1 Tax=Bursaphelenchus okinawaensis TaxID=465554 RepID=A0A811LAF8_9BILA|nr:unnamed protein product [Bursaphelenchus okinawaensis]CAG9120744.1 unnamed protein product [Bursaphelenchus okinawaensis]
MNRPKLTTLLLLLQLNSYVAVNYINFVVDSVRSEEAALQCKLNLYDQTMTNTIANLTFDCSPGIPSIDYRLDVNKLSYPIVLMLSIENAVNHEKVHQAYTVLNTLENAPNHMKYTISEEKFSMIYKTSLQCDGALIGRYCNVTCEEPKMTDHYVCSREGKICNKGWLGPNCDQPYCTTNCSRHGLCVSPGVCACDSGWVGKDCDECIRREGCVYGYCSDVPYSCKCKVGYSGPLCDRHVSSECILSDCVHGQCAFMRGNKVCHCEEGYFGKSCDQKIPKIGLPPAAPPQPNPPINPIHYWHPSQYQTSESTISANTLLLLAAFTIVFCSATLLLQKLYKTVKRSRSVEQTVRAEARLFTSPTPPPPYPVDNPKLLA